MVSSKSYGYMPVAYVRNALLAIGRALANATVQVLWLQMPMMSPWWFLDYAMAYRNKVDKHLDAARHLFVPMVVSWAAFDVDDVVAVSIAVGAFVFAGVMRVPHYCLVA